MKIRIKQFGFSLTEMVVVVAILALLTGLGLPAIRSLQKSFESGSGIIATINATLSTARAIAEREQRYVGVRFQLDTNGDQYMIFIIHDPEKTTKNGFRALEGRKPMKLPDDFRVIDMKYRTSVSNPESLSESHIELLNSSVFDNYDTPISLDGQIDTIRDTSCFSIIFSPMGKLVIHEVRVRNKDGIYKPNNSTTNKISMDDIFNSPENILNYKVGMFVQDDDFADFGGNSSNGSLGAEYSRSQFYIYDKNNFDKLRDSVQRLDYLKKLEPVLINHYTGRIVK